jgi:hypothetical protein
LGVNQKMIRRGGGDDRNKRKKIHSSRRPTSETILIVGLSNHPLLLNTCVHRYSRMQYYFTEDDEDVSMDYQLFATHDNHRSLLVPLDVVIGNDVRFRWRRHGVRFF